MGLQTAKPGRIKLGLDIKKYIFVLFVVYSLVFLIKLHCDIDKDTARFILLTVYVM